MVEEVGLSQSVLRVPTVELDDVLDGTVSVDVDEERVGNDVEVDAFVARGCSQRPVVIVDLRGRKVSLKAGKVERLGVGDILSVGNLVNSFKGSSHDIAGHVIVASDLDHEANDSHRLIWN